MTTTTSSETAILSRVIQPECDDLSPEAARCLLQLDFSDSDRDRMHDLSAKARQGTLTAEEEEELGSYIQVGHLLALLQSRARMSLKRAGVHP